MPRGLPAIWLQNPYSTVIVPTPKMTSRLSEVLNTSRMIHFDGRPVPKNQEPWFHGTPNHRWEGDTLVIESIGFDDRTFIMPKGWFFFFNDTATTEIYTLSLHDALPI